jgi:putative transposase
MRLAPQEIRTYFVTTVTASRRRLFQVESNAQLFVDVLQDQRAKNRIALHAFVIMPDHVHLILTPAPEISLEKAMQYIKGGFSFQLKSNLDV